MSINELLVQKNITKYRLWKESGVPQATISDICTGKTSIEKCSAETIYRIAKVLDVSMESLIAPAVQRAEEERHRPSFELFKSNTCHMVKDMGDIPFIIQLLETNQIRKLYEKKWYPEALYLLAMLDYLSRENNVPICKNYNDIRTAKLQRPVYPSSVVILCKTLNSDAPKEECYRLAIPEFLRFNIVESEVRNVC
ncbi:MAG: helix-turn-helix transcriptional regulator [Oscillospiraceae bacterium]|nr:helix-turn-helix transcriptional regulator [Oscillospiraceae bacterium]